MKDHEKKSQLPSSNPYHWLYYIFCLIFKDFSVKFQSDDNFIQFIDIKEEITKKSFQKIYSHLSNKIMINEKINDFDELISLVNSILFDSSINKINSNIYHKGCLTSIKNGQNNTNSEKQFQKPIDPILSFNKKNDMIFALGNENFCEKNHSTLKNDIHLFDHNLCNPSYNNNTFLNNINNDLDCNVINPSDDISKNNYKYPFFSKIKNDIQNNLSRDNSHINHFPAEEPYGGSNVYNIHNYFHISNPYLNLNFNGIFNNICYNNYNQFYSFFDKNESSNQNQIDYECLYRNNELDKNSLDKKLNEYETKNKYISNFELFCFSNYFNNNRKYLNDFPIIQNSNTLNKDNANKFVNESLKVENDFLRKKRLSSFKNTPSLSYNGNDNINEIIFQNDYLASSEKINNKSKNNQNDKNDNLTDGNEANVGNNIYIKSNERYGNVVDCLDTNKLNNDLDKDKNIITCKKSILNDLLLGENKNKLKSNPISNKIKNFEIKKIKRPTNEESEKKTKINTSSNIFNIQNIPNMKKSNPLLISLKFFNDKTIKNVNKLNVKVGNESLQDFSINQKIGLEKHNFKKELTSEIKDKRNHLLKTEYSPDYISNNFLNPEYQNNIDYPNKKENEYPEIINSIFNDSKVEKDKTFIDGFFPISEIFNDFNTKLNKEKEYFSDKKEKPEKLRENQENDGFIEDRTNEKSCQVKLKNNTIFNITKKICMNNVRSRLGNLINFKRRKLSIENNRKKSLKKINRLYKSNEVNFTQDNCDRTRKNDGDTKFNENAILHIDRQNIVLDKKVLSFSMNKKEKYYQKYSKTGYENIRENNKIYLKINTELMKRMNYCKKKNFIKQRKKDYLFKGNEFQSDCSNNIKSIKISKNSRKFFLNNSKSITKNLSKKLFTHKLDRQSRKCNYISFNNKKVNEIKCISSHISITNSVISNKSKSSISEFVKNKSENIYYENDNRDLVNINFEEFKNDLRYDSANKKPKKSIDRYFSNKKNYMDDKINSFKLDIDSYMDQFPKDLEIKLLDNKHVFMKKNFPIMYQLENFHLFITSKTSKIFNWKENTAKLQKKPDIFDQETLKNYIENIKFSIFGDNDDEKRNFIEVSNCSKNSINPDLKNIDENKANDGINLNGNFHNKSSSETIEAMSNSNNTSNLSHVGYQTDIYVDNTTNVNLKENSLIDLKIINRIEENKKSEAEKQIKYSKVNEGYLNKYTENDTVDCIGFYEQNNKNQNFPKHPLNNINLKESDFNIKHENPLYQNKLWSPYVLDNCQSKYYKLIVFLLIQ